MSLTGTLRVIYLFNDKEIDHSFLFYYSDISDYMQDFRAPVECLYSRIVQIQGNLDEVKVVHLKIKQIQEFQFIQLIKLIMTGGDDKLGKSSVVC
jgi:hypothetical protein